ncbi:hypothetical protein F4782DRAFT_493790 [Xylaria castorea]|nr:hypothetical protein F4782DRAFT_493790 [Xylaria castorea]
MDNVVYTYLGYGTVYYAVALSTGTDHIGSPTRGFVGDKSNLLGQFRPLMHVTVVVFWGAASWR